MLKETSSRIIKSAVVSFWRNGWLSTATVLVMVLTLFVIGGLLLSSVLMNTILDSLEERIDVSVYFLPNTQEELIVGLKADFEKIPNVSAVSYVSQAEALERFRERHKNNPLILESLAELEENPLEASLNISAADTSKFQEIVTAIEVQEEPTIDKINFFENQRAIERLSKIMVATRTTGAAIAAILAFIAVLVAFNTVRLAIYTARGEINVMRLVGATAWHIRGPFLIEGVIDGGLAAVITAAIYIPTVWFLAPNIQNFLDGINMFQYLMGHLLEFFAILFASGVLLGILSSILAVRRYLKV